MDAGATERYRRDRTREPTVLENPPFALIEDEEFFILGSIDGLADEVDYTTDDWCARAYDHKGLVAGSAPQ